MDSIKPTNPKSDWHVDKTNMNRHFMKVGGGSVSLKGTWSNRVKERTNMFSKVMNERLDPLGKIKNIFDKRFSSTKNGSNKENNPT